MSARTLPYDHESHRNRRLTLLTDATLHTADHRSIIEQGTLAIWGDQQLWLGDAQGASEGILATLAELEKEGICDAKQVWITREIIRCKGEHIAPGFVDAHVHLGLYPEGFVGEPKDLNELTHPLTPQLRALDGIWPGDIAFKKAREGGVTSVCVLPGSANVIGGVGMVLKTAGHDVEQMSVRDPACLKIAFGYNVKHNHGLKGRSPLTRMALADLLRTAFEGALAYEERRLKDPLTPIDRGKEHLLLALKRSIPVRAHAARSDDILTAIRLAREFGFKLVIEHGYEAIDVIDQLLEVDASVVYGPAFRTCGHSEDLNFSFTHAQRLLEAGIKVAHMTDHPIVPIQYLSLQAGLCVREGLSTEEALKLITAYPAEILGCEASIGRLKVGLDADLVRLSGPPLELASRVIQTYIGGRVVYHR